MGKIPSTLIDSLVFVSSCNTVTGFLCLERLGRFLKTPEALPAVWTTLQDKRGSWVDNVWRTSVKVGPQDGTGLHVCLLTTLCFQELGTEVDVPSHVGTIHMLKELRQVIRILEEGLLEAFVIRYGRNADEASLLPKDGSKESLPGLIDLRRNTKN
jgi:hypothetical protein